MAKTPKLNAPSIKIPVLKTNTAFVMKSLTHGLMMELSYYKKIKETKTQEQKPIGAGRGGKQCVTGSHYSRFY